MKADKASVQKALNYIKSKKFVFVDFKFIDLLGTWQHYTMPAKEVNEGTFSYGVGFDGSSIRLWKNIHESDMLLIPDPATMFEDHFFDTPTVSFICDIYDPITKDKYEKCPRSIARKAEEYLKSSKIGDIAYFGPEAEFFIFDTVRFDSHSPEQAFYYINSIEAHHNTGEDFEANRGYIAGRNGGYFPAMPTDTLTNLRGEMVKTMLDWGIDIEAHHHEVASSGQCEIDMRFQPMLKMADYLMMYKYAVKNTAVKFGKTATFMPKPFENENGSGMHVNMSLWKKGKSLFAGKSYAGLSETALHFIGGIIKHAYSIMAFTNPITNSYKRLVPGFEAPVYLAYSQRNRSAALRIPMYSDNPKAKRLEFRCPDPAANPYLAFSAILMAGLDGIENKINPGDPVDEDIFALPKKKAAKIGSTPATLGDALNALKRDNKFLMKGGVFTEAVIESWIEYKFNNEILPLAIKPHPHEFTMYYNV